MSDIENNIHRLRPSDPSVKIERPDWDIMTGLFKNNGAISKWEADDLDVLKKYVMRRFCTRYTMEDVEALNNLVQLLETIESAITAAATPSEPGE